jgi:hypothetical protein
LTTEGEEVVITPPVDAGSDSPDEGSLIVTVVETDPDTGAVDAQAIRTAEQTFTRLSAAIDHEISLAQEQLLKIRMSKTASVHLTRLYDTLDQIQADSQVLIEEAYAEFQASYTIKLDENFLDPPLVHITGRVLTRTAVQLVVATKGNGRRIYVLIPTGVKVVLLDGNPGTIGEVVHDDWVDVTATSQTSTSSPIARVINVVPSPDGPGDSGDNSNSNGNGNENGKSSYDTITGTIVLVDAGKSGNQRVIVVSNPAGSDGAAGINSDTVVSGDDGFSATNIEVTPLTEPAATPAPPIEYILSGNIKTLSAQGVILDDVYLALDSNSPTVEPLEVGQQIQFKVIVDADGRWVVVGIEP